MVWDAEVIPKLVVDANRGTVLKPLQKYVCQAATKKELIIVKSSNFQKK